ncbi:pesticin C-terminus-like muramidase [Salmonella enterica subsp. diarizonae serovar 16:z10:e,n,x,z15]|uniref:Peptidase n=1 Tax=Citrobacter braakii TaxID=57706 RepID=A0A1V8NRN2_CITBR|nr:MULTISPECIES: pesticin C-terminus-like muramidase [Enterobacteriaceae]MCH5485639.1 pesticin C-terminus-like muramidase [Salmonella enterica subsp. diarizonae serovar 16:z10:e,n,x,z15]OQM39071.1 peptidase [Citrobacter braakii]QXC19316.1 peptidase [Citrobacter braakii]CEJ66607.1 Pesticin [Citrobacter pasteurii]
MSDTMTVVANVPTLFSGTTLSSFRPNFEANTITIALPHYVDVPGRSNFKLMYIFGFPFDTEMEKNDDFSNKPRAESKISKTEGTVSYEQKITVESGGIESDGVKSYRVMVLEGTISDAINHLDKKENDNILNQYKNRIVLADNTVINFDNAAQLKEFLHRSLKIVDDGVITSNGFEGFNPKSHFPSNPGDKYFNNTGVTFGSGVDLGKRGKQDLLNDGVPQNIADKLDAYYMLRGQDAYDKVRTNPLTLPDNEARLLSDIYITKFSKQIEGVFNDANIGIRFSEIPLRTRTALVSLGYQHGYYLPKTTPNVWNKVTSKDWSGLVNELNNFGGGFPDRRKREGSLIQADIDAGLLN